MTDKYVVEVEDALGPGLDFERDERYGLIGTRVRRGGTWQGIDRGAFPESDDGRGVRLAALVTTPISTWVGCRLAVELLGGWRWPGRVVLLVGVPGSVPPERDVAARVGRIGADAAWFGPPEATQQLRRARQRYRERRSHARVLGGRAWLPDAPTRLEDRRFSTPHSAAEYDLRRLPPRYLRGLDGILDDDERLVYAIERPEVHDRGLLARIRREDRRAALLALTDRQLIWSVDHAQPDRFRSDWGVDLEIIPVERVTGVSTAIGTASHLLVVSTGPTERRFSLPVELGAEVDVMAALLTRFVPDAASRLPRRLYPLSTATFEDDWAGRFGQLDLARETFARAGVDEPLAHVFSPRREGRPSEGAAVLGQGAIVFLDAHGRRSFRLDAVGALQCTVSALIGRVGVLTVNGVVELSYPAPLSVMGTTFTRLARRAIADVPGT